MGFNDTTFVNLLFFQREAKNSHECKHPTDPQVQQPSTSTALLLINTIHNLFFTFQQSRVQVITKGSFQCERCFFFWSHVFGQLSPFQQQEASFTTVELL